jgi:hypothetical protein
LSNAKEQAVPDEMHHVFTLISPGNFAWAMLPLVSEISERIGRNPEIALLLLVFDGPQRFVPPHQTCQIPTKRGRQIERKDGKADRQTMCLCAGVSHPRSGDGVGFSDGSAPVHPWTMCSGPDPAEAASIGGAGAHAVKNSARLSSPADTGADNPAGGAGSEIPSHFEAGGRYNGSCQTGALACRLMVAAQSESDSDDPPHAALQLTRNKADKAEF